MKSEKTFKWCLKKGKPGGKHRGIAKIGPDPKEAAAHIEKAQHNLRAVDYNIAGGFQDWAVSAAFYTMYHALLALLYKLGYESRNQECTLSATEYLISKGRLPFEKRYVAKVRSAADMTTDAAKTLRERFQYGTEVRVNKILLNKLRKDAVEIIEAAQVALEELNETETSSS